MCERYTAHPQLGPWPTTQACALTCNQTGDTLGLQAELNPLNHTRQGSGFSSKVAGAQVRNDRYRVAND